jgi:uncharacterized iron-regulated membrane protein
MTFRKILFWTHLVIGLTAGGVIAVVAFTGATMAFEQQVIAWAERDLRRVTPPTPDAPRLPLEKILAQLRTAQPEARPAAFIVSADPTAPITVSLGRTGSLYVNPYTGDAQPSGAKEVRAFFRLMLTWHRWLGVSAPPRPEGAEARPESPPREGMAERPASPLTARQFAGTVVGVATIVFLALTLSGLWLWWPRQWSWRALKSTTVPNLKLSGRARDWNWHNALGFWTAPLIIVIAFTGVVMAFRDFSTWLYGPRETIAPPAITAPTPDAKPLGPDALFASAQKEIPTWSTLTLRLAAPEGRGSRGPSPRRVEPSAAATATAAPRPETPSATAATGTEPAARRRGPEGRGGESRAPQAATLTVLAADAWPRTATITLQLDPYTGAVLRRTGLSDLSFAQAMRSLNLRLHTGEAGGLPGQILAFIACVAALVLVYTGFALSWRRFFGQASAAAPRAASFAHSKPQI